MNRRSFLEMAIGALALPALGRAAEPQGQGSIDSLFSLHDAEVQAGARLPADVFAYIRGGAGDEITLRWNQERFQEMRLRPRVLADLGNLDLSTRLLGRELPVPVLFAPTAANKLAHAEGEVAVARGAGAVATTYVLSSNATTSIEDVKRVSTHPVWFQLYIQSDPGFTRELVRRVESAGSEALCVTVDSPVPGARNTIQRAGFRLPPGMIMPHLVGAGALRSVVTLDRVVPPRIVWQDIEALVAYAKVPVFLKGILDPRDAAIAVKCGVAGLIVSNHGGRILDTLPATIDALPGVVAEVAGRVPVLMDGGIRRGTDVVKAIALGATAVMIGRPYLYGLAVGGAEGVAQVQKILLQEIRLALALLGRPSLASLDASVLWNQP